jgi:hypothetical protein
MGLREYRASAGGGGSGRGLREYRAPAGGYYKGVEGKKPRRKAGRREETQKHDIQQPHPEGWGACWLSGFPSF